MIKKVKVERTIEETCYEIICDFCNHKIISSYKNNNNCEICGRQTCYYCSNYQYFIFEPEAIRLCKFCNKFYKKYCEEFSKLEEEYNKKFNKIKMRFKEESLNYKGE